MVPTVEENVIALSWKLKAVPKLIGNRIQKQTLMSAALSESSHCFSATDCAGSSIQTVVNCL